MIAYGDAAEYIAEERRQLVEAIRDLQHAKRRKTGQDVDFDTAKREFLDREFETFIETFRRRHRPRRARVQRLPA